MSKKTGKTHLSFIAADGPHTADCDKNLVGVSMKNNVQVQHELGFCKYGIASSWCWNTMV
ncbi:MAG: hypothetical protein IPL98_19345 [Saprospiraceae bacterium]|nr:hypothetical protein [Saprospiraceae bacterium]